MIAPTIDRGLDVDQATLRYSGRVALDGVSLRAPLGRVTGLIGPNGAGKTSMFNACSGLVGLRSGQIRFAGRDVTNLSPARRARLGLGRTFQRMELFESQTVRANVELGREAALAGSNPVSHIWARRRDAGAIRQASAEALERCDIADIAERSVASLSTGQRRLVELARVVASGRSLLLLDEPSSGLDHAETERFGRVLLALVAGRGLGVLLVEHDMSLVTAVCEHVFVLDFGRMLFEGSPEEAHADETVRRAYLGSAP